MVSRLTQKAFLGLVCLFTAVFSIPLFAQVDQGQTGAWTMYMWNTENRETGFGWQGDIQHRNWDTTQDLEQLLIREVLPGGLSRDQ